MTRQSQTSRNAAEHGFGSLPDPREQRKRGEKQKPSAAPEGAPPPLRGMKNPTEAAVDAAAQAKYGPVAAELLELQQKFDEKIDKIQAKSDEKISAAHKKMEEMRAAFLAQQGVQSGPEVAQLKKEFNEKIAKIQADCNEKIAAAHEKYKLRRGIAEGEARLNDTRSDATGLDSVATSGGRGRKKYKDSATGKMVPERTLPEALSKDNMLITWYTGSSAHFDEVDVEFPAGDGEVQIVTMPLLLCRAPNTESGSFMCYDINGNRVHCKNAGPYRKPDAVTLESIHNIPAFKKALNPLQEVDDLFKGLKVRMAEGRRSDCASSASMDNDGR